MRVRLLGTGAADGWPNAFCGCTSCRAAHRDNEIRRPTSALIDDRILLDCGPDTPYSALHHGASLSAVSHIFVTHDHPGRSAPMALLTRSWARRAEPITIVGPAPVIASWSSWADPADPVRWRVVMAGDILTFDGYTVGVLDAADGDIEGMVYDVAGPDRHRLLYGTDTGPLPESTIRATAGAAYDLVLLAATPDERPGQAAPLKPDHLSAFADQLTRLRGVGALTIASEIAPIHLSHHSPPDLAYRLQGWGATIHADGHEFRLGQDPPSATFTHDVDTESQRITKASNLLNSSSRAPEPRRTLILGGARSGKSQVAERLLSAQPLTCIRPGPRLEGVADLDRPPPHWTTVESTDLTALLRTAHQPILIDGLSQWLTAVMTDSGAWRNTPGWELEVDRQLADLQAAWQACPVTVVAITNEVGSGVVPGATSARLFRDRLGILNARLAGASERVLLVVAGRVVELADLDA